MLEMIRKAWPAVSLDFTTAAISLGTVIAFLWLVAHGFVQPFGIYLLELYLAL